MPDNAAARPSLLWPGQVRRRLERWDWWFLGAAYVLAVAVRWTIRDAGPYTAEAAHYALSRHLWHGVDNVASLFPDVRPDDFSWFFWQRPLLCLLYWPAAQGGFGVYRAVHILVAGTVPVLAAILLRQMGARPAYAHGAAAVLAVHPVLVPWGVLVLPDTTVAAFTLAGLLAAHDGRPWATAGLLLAGSWVKEVGFVTPAALFVLSAWREADGTRARLWPLRLGRFSTLMLPVALLSFLPLAVSLALPNGTPPGFRVGGGLDQSLERQFLLLWLAPVVLGGLFLPRVRRLCLVALAWPAFFVVYHVATGKAIEIWYNVVPATLTLVASAATVDALPRKGPFLWRGVPWKLASLLVAALLVQVAVPSGSPVNRAVATPLSHVGQWDLEQALASEEARGDGLEKTLARIPSGHDRAWLALDMDYSLVMFPLAERAHVVYKDFTLEWNMTDDGLRWWADAVENRTDATLLGGTPDSLSRALVEAYAPCAATYDTYSVIVPDACHGYGDRLIAAWHRQRAMAGMA